MDSKARDLPNEFKNCAIPGIEGYGAIVVRDVYTGWYPGNPDQNNDWCIILIAGFDISTKEYALPISDLKSLKKS